MPLYCLVPTPNPTRCHTSNELGVYVEVASVNQGQEVKNPLAQECNADRQC